MQHDGMQDAQQPQDAVVEEQQEQPAATLLLHGERLAFVVAGVKDDAASRVQAGAFDRPISTSFAVGATVDLSTVNEAAGDGSMLTVNELMRIVAHCFKGLEPKVLSDALLANASIQVDHEGHPSYDHPWVLRGAQSLQIMYMQVPIDEPSEDIAADDITITLYLPAAAMVKARSEFLSRSWEGLNTLAQAAGVGPFKLESFAKLIEFKGKPIGAASLRTALGRTPGCCAALDCQLVAAVEAVIEKHVNERCAGLQAALHEVTPPPLMPQTQVAARIRTVAKLPEAVVAYIEANLSKYRDGSSDEKGVVLGAAMSMFPQMSRVQVRKAFSNMAQKKKRSS